MNMKKFVATVLLIVFPVTVIAQEGVKTEEPKSIEYESGYLDGEASASENYSGGGWFAAGLGGGFLLGLLGGGIIVGISQSGTVEPPTMHKMGVLDKSSKYKMGFYDGYSKKAKKKRLTYSITGGLLGTAVIVMVILSNQK